MLGRRIRVSFLLAVSLAVAAGAQQLPFRVEMSPPRLSNHQRLRTTITVRIDGAAIAKLKGQGQLDIEIEIVDRKGVRYKSTGGVSTEKVTGARPQDIFFAQDLFVLPGHYAAYVSVGDSVTGEGAAARHTFDVAGIQGDPLPRAWRDLPDVEFLAPVDPPDRWYQPSLNGRLHLPVDTSQAVKIDVLVNTTPTEATGVSGRINELNMGTLLPALRTLAQIDPLEGTISVTLLDLTRRRVIFEQPWVRELDWSHLRESLASVDPNVVDVKSLASREQRAEFFLEEVGKHVEAALEPDEPPHILIVLSGPMVFGDKVALHPITTPGNENCKVFYIRYSWAAPRPTPSATSTAVQAPIVVPGAANPTGRGAAGTSVGTNAPRRNAGQVVTPDMIAVAPPPRPSPLDDYLESTLKPLKPRLFDVDSPIAFRRALAALLAEIAKM